MRHEDAALALWLAADSPRERRPECYEPVLVTRAAGAHAFRRRVGAAFIALGERLTGDARAVEPGSVRRRRLASHAS